MFYISSKQGNNYGITDTRDNVEEFYSIDSLTKLIIRGIPITGVIGINSRTGNPNVYVFPKKHANLLGVKKGTPVVIKFSQDTAPKQCVVVDVSQVGITLFDGTFFSFTYDFISRANMVFDFNANDPCKLNTLLRRLGA